MKAILSALILTLFLTGCDTAEVLEVVSDPIGGIQSNVNRKEPISDLDVSSIRDYFRVNFYRCPETTMTCINKSGGTTMFSKMDYTNEFIFNIEEMAFTEKYDSSNENLEWDWIINLDLYTGIVEFNAIINDLYYGYTEEVNGYLDLNTDESEVSIVLSSSNYESRYNEDWVYSELYEMIDRVDRMTQEVFGYDIYDFLAIGYLK
jgi:hypothetical protein